MSDRVIFKRSWSTRTDVADVLQVLFLSEMLNPSTTVWLVSPWVSDIAVIDNRSGAFDTILDPQWGQREIHLAEVLGRAAAIGAQVCIATRPDAHNDRFLNRLHRETGSAASHRLLTHRKAELHEKGLLGDSYHLSGSMNFTHGGVTLLEEAVRLTTAPEAIAEAQIEYYHRWGGRLGAPA